MEFPASEEKKDTRKTMNDYYLNINRANSRRNTLTQTRTFLDELEEALNKKFKRRVTLKALRLTSPKASDNEEELPEGFSFPDSARERIFSATDKMVDKDAGWELDAENGFLSYSKMRSVRNNR